jgi:hypothetical protein
MVKLDFIRNQLLPLKQAVGRRCNLKLIATVKIGCKDLQAEII